MKRTIIFLTLFLVIFITLPDANSEEKNWFGGTGLWDDPLNWDPYGTPEIDDWVVITNAPGSSETVYFSGNAVLMPASYPSFHIYGTGSATMTLSISDGYLASVLENIIGNNGVVYQTGGTFHVDNTLIDTGGTYNLENGFFDFSIYNLTIAGVFNQTGGVAGGPCTSVQVVSGGVYNLSGSGIVTTDMYGFYVSKDSHFNQYGGSANWGYVSEVKGTYNLIAGEVNSYVGERTASYIYDEGIFTQYGGTHNVKGKLIVGSSLLGTVDKGTYNLAGGSLTASSIINDDTINYSGGELHLGTDGTDALTNNGTTNLSGSGTRTIDGNVVNNGTFKTTHTTAEYIGTFTNNGAYVSDPAVQYFNDLIINQSGYLVGQHSDRFYIRGDFLNYSEMNEEWNTRHAYLGFPDGADNLHDFYITGYDYGATMSGYANNFSWGVMDITDNYINLYDGNDELGAALYLRELWGLEITEDLIISNLTGFDGLNIYYMPNLDGNSYLTGLTYSLSGGGLLMPSVPEPATLLLLGSGLIGLAAFRRKFRKS